MLSDTIIDHNNMFDALIRFLRSNLSFSVHWFVEIPKEHQQRYKQNQAQDFYHLQDQATLLLLTIFSIYASFSIYMNQTVYHAENFWLYFTFIVICIILAIIFSRIKILAPYFYIWIPLIISSIANILFYIGIKSPDIHLSTHRLFLGVCMITVGSFGLRIPTISVLLTLALSSISLLFTTSSHQGFAQNMLMSYVVFSIGLLFSSLLQEHKERKHFLQSIELEYKNQEVEKLNQELAHIAHIDSLSGLANRRLFDQNLSKLWHFHKHEQMPLSLMMIDIDFFKRYNDTYGHLEGDSCIERIALCLTELCNHNPQLLASRYGGEEFTILMTKTSSEQALDLATQVHHAITALKIKHKTSKYPYVSASIGIASCVPHSQISTYDLIKSADEALYEAKSKGRNCIIVGEDLPGLDLYFDDTLQFRLQSKQKS